MSHRPATKPRSQARQSLRHGRTLDSGLATRQSQWNWRQQRPTLHFTVPAGPAGLPHAEQGWLQGRQCSRSSEQEHMLLVCQLPTRPEKQRAGSPPTCLLSKHSWQRRARELMPLAGCLQLW